MRTTILSGKGGVGKSMLTASLAILFSRNKNVVAIDCDVDAPNLGLWLGIDTSKNKDVEEKKKISTVAKPFVDKDKCTNCGKCVQACNFNALENKDKDYANLVSYRCEGCGLCQYVCFENAIEMKPVKNCTIKRFITEWGFPSIQGQISPGEAESGEAVTEIREYANSFGKKDTIYLQDGAAGIGCPVIASVVGSDYAVLVTESSKSSFSDMKRALEVVESLKVPYGIVINKHDLNKSLTNRIENFANKRLLGKISYNKRIIQNIADLRPVINNNKTATNEIQNIFTKLKKKMKL